MPNIVAALIIGGSGIAVASVVALGPAELGRGSEPSDNLRLVRADPTWLSYLPSTAGAPELALASLTRELVDGSATRRVDLLVVSRREPVSLCFADSRAHLVAACPGARVLGQISRDVDQPWIAQIGSSSVDFRSLLSGPVPTLANADYLDE